MKSPGIAGLILSGGASQRMGTPKALLNLDGITFLDRLQAVFSAACDPVLVVLGYEAGRIRQAVTANTNVEFLVNPDPARGMFSSLQYGLASLRPDIEAVIFTPVDYPAMRASTVASLARAYRQSGRPVTLPRHHGDHGHPVCVSRRVIDELLALPVSAQARDVIREYRAQTEFVDVDDPGILADVDLPEDYRQLQAQAGLARP